MCIQPKPINCSFLHQENLQAEILNAAESIRKLKWAEQGVTMKTKQGNCHLSDPHSCQNPLDQRMFWHLWGNLYHVDCWKLGNSTFPLSYIFLPWTSSIGLHAPLLRTLQPFFCKPCAQKPWIRNQILKRV